MTIRFNDSFKLIYGGWVCSIIIQRTENPFAAVFPRPFCLSIAFSLVNSFGLSLSFILFSSTFCLLHYLPFRPIISYFRSAPIPPNDSKLQVFQFRLTDPTKSKFVWMAKSRIGETNGRNSNQKWQSKKCTSHRSIEREYKQTLWPMLKPE